MEDFENKMSKLQLDEIEKQFIRYMVDKRLLDERKNINTPYKGIAEMGLSYRLINHWEQNGIIEVERGVDGKGWRKISFMDQIWIRLVVELRSFGISLENIKTIYNQIRTNDIDYSPSVYPRLEFFIHYFINYKIPIKLIILKDFTVFICTKEEIEGAEKEDLLDSYISINLHKLIQYVLKESFYKPNYNEEVVLSEKEIKLLYHLRIGSYKSVKVLFKDGKIERIEGEISIVEKKVHELMKENNYDKIIINREKGDVVSIEQTVKIKL
jgi:DNA-binding transcriptional MerR regulator